MSRCIFLGHLVLDGRVRQDTNGLGEVMDARVWPSLQRQTVRWERHGELWQNSGRHHQESIRGLCFPLRNLFQQQRLSWPQGYFSMVQKKREIGNKWNLPTYHSTEHVRSRPRLAISYKSLFFSNLSPECVLLFAGTRKDLLSFQTNSKFVCKWGTLLWNRKCELYFVLWTEKCETIIPSGSES